MPQQPTEANPLNIGDYYEDCSFHPLLLISITEEHKDKGLSGISLVDGLIRNCSLKHCGIRKLTVEEAILWKLKGPQDVDHSKDWNEKDKWWLK